MLSFEGPLAIRLGYDSDLLGRVCQRFAHRVMAALRRHTKRAHGLATVAALHPGIVIVVQRFRPERVCRYLLRPPFAHDAIEALPDGRVRVHFSRPTRAGASFTTITRDAFLARLAALVPPPRFNMTRYYGVLAGRHALRPLVAQASDPDNDVG